MLGMVAGRSGASSNGVEAREANPQAAKVNAESQASQSNGRSRKQTEPVQRGIMDTPDRGALGVSNFSFRRLFAFLGLIADGYMDPGNWATSLAGGSACGTRS